MQENRIIPTETTTLPDSRWLIFAPHPDDESFGMGGTLILGKHKGIDMHLAVMTDGSRGGDKDVRKQELTKAAAFLNVNSIHFLGFTDRELEYNNDSIRQSLELIKAVKPDHIFFPSDTELHPDHRSAHQIIMRAAYLSGKKLSLYCYEISHHSKINVLIDISTVIKEKKKLINIYKSQLKANNYKSHILAMNTTRTYTLNQSDFAEGFYHQTLENTEHETHPESMSDKKKPDTSNLPLVSVLIRTYNRPSTLQHALFSTVAQTYRNIEIVVVNDGGEDVSSITDSFKSERTNVHYIEHGCNSGRASAANSALKASHGKYCLFLDDDDLIDSDHIETLVSHIEKKHTGSAVYSGVRVVDVYGNVCRTCTNEYNPVKLKVSNYLPIHCVLFKRKMFLEGCHFDESLPYLEDWDFWLQLSQKTDFSYTGKITATYRPENDSTRIPLSERHYITHKASARLLEKWKQIWTGDDIIEVFEFLKNSQENSTESSIDRLPIPSTSEISGENRIQFKTKLKQKLINLFRMMKNREYNTILIKLKKNLKQLACVFNMKQNSHTESIVFHTPQYVSYTEHSQHNRTIKLIAFYLPQYHSIPENDAAWGKGFTDWNNVAKARPLLKNHYQPRIPGELGFYNLKDINKQKRQIELAKNYGIHGFCYHFYWFAGKMVMSTPLKQLLLNEELDFPFCINWANENWTKRWDGLDNEIILEQKHSVEDDLEFIQNVLPIFSDKRYIRVGDRPLLMIYRPDLFPDFSSTVKRWRKYALDYGENLFIVCTHSFDSINPETILCDAAVEFSPNNCGLTSERVTSKTKQTDINLFNYESLANKSIADPVPGYVKFRGLCPGWDNTSRRKNSPTIFYNSSPELYGRWLESLALYTFRNLCEENQFVFINAWNEWAEGAYLEPDAEYGYSYLESTWNSISKFTPELLSYTHTLNTVKKYADTAVIMHLYYPELMDEMAYYINNLDVESDVFISITPDLDPDSLTRLKTLFPDAYICLFENRGRDILPFIKIFEKIYPLEYKSICKIHTKKSPHRIDGDIWRKQMLESVAGSKETTHNILKMFENDQNLGLVIPDKYACHFKFDEGSNKECIKYCTKELGIKMVDDFIFPAGSMFWARPECLKQLSFLPSTCHFDLEQGQLDGTMAHSLERLFGLLCKVNQFKTEIIESPS